MLKRLLIKWSKMFCRGYESIKNAGTSKGML